MRKILAAVALVLAAVAAVYIISPPSKSFKIRSRILGEKRVILEYVPKGYASSGKTFPVLLHLDADPSDSTYGPSFYRIAKNVNRLGTPVPEMIVLGITNTDRTRDMIPAKDTSSGVPVPGEAQNFLGFITDELIPEIRSRFRTSEMFLLYGRSDSGLFALYAFMESPDTFQAVIAASPSLGRCPAFMKAGMTKLFGERPDQAGTLFIVYGAQERILSPLVTRFANTIKSVASDQLVLGIKRVEGAGHIPKSSLEDGLKFVFSQQRGGDEN